MQLLLPAEQVKDYQQADKISPLLAYSA